MGFRDGLNALLGRGNEPQYVDWLGPTFRQMILGLTPEELYRTQPHLRTVLSFVARNVAHLGLKAYSRTSDTDRTRLKDDPLALLLRQPNPSQTMFEVLETLASDLGLYDVAYWFVGENPDRPSGWVLQPIPPAWVVGQRKGTFFAPAEFVVQNPDGTRATVPADNMLVFHGWNPSRPKYGASPVETLKQVLSEQVQAWSYREQVWQNGGRVGSVITRPKEAAWSDAARERFARDWKDRWTGRNGKKAGGTPILEDGMELKQMRFNAREEEWAEVAKLALSTVAGVYHVNPVMVGILDNANFSNTKEFRKMLYGETLGPTLARIEDRINTFLVPRITKADGAYVEFNIEEKLQGDFETQAAILSTSAGAPWMTRNEVRALRNLPAVEGGDELVVPMNVTTGGQASPRDSAPPKATAGALKMLDELTNTHPKLAEDIGELRVVRIPPDKKSGRWKVRAKSQVTEPQSRKAEEVIAAFFERQRKTVLSALGAKAGDDWWDAERWDRELGDDLFALALFVSSVIGKDVAASMGFSESDYDVARTEAFLREVAKSRAGAINSTTREQIQAVLDGDGPDGVDDPAHAFDIAEGARKGVIAGTLLTTVAAFATVEAARQNGGASKTWLVTSGNPRPAHAAMDGESVGLDDTFSNGAKWPGDPVLGVDGVAGCTCDVEVTFG